MKLTVKLRRYFLLTPNGEASSSQLSSASGSKSASKFARMNRLRELEMKMNEARKMNHAEVVAEDERKKRPQNFEAKRKRLEWEQEEEDKKKECLERGESYDRMKVMTIGADEAERWEKKKRKKNPDLGFADYEQATFRQYSHLTKQIKPDTQEVSRQKEQLGEDFYATADTLGLHQRKDSDEAIDRMVGDLEKQIEKRSKYSRRRTFDEEADVDYINERNAKFNQKLERFYGKYTAEIKQNLERGTAV
ncbi:neurogenic locus notch homolog protein 1 [Plakobranchus ocellatus]|uniref:Pre-mRNA-splicing factor SYF2 n=1 Tax=Plakobranchus ocellatus TaxID=259542 RepID=A0AAV4B3R5_9GAST|nr:neurogenic locus notch homolog protein 1 [Plakobranchus ocellatus]